MCTGVTAGGVITGKLFVGSGGQRRDFSLEQVGAGLAMVDQRKIDYGEAPRILVEAQAAAQRNKVGIWSLEQKQPEVIYALIYVSVISLKALFAHMLFFRTTAQVCDTKSKRISRNYYCERNPRWAHLLLPDC